MLRGRIVIVLLVFAHGLTTCCLALEAGERVFVGDVYEKSNTQEIKYIFLGGRKIATVTTPSTGSGQQGGAVHYHHHNHLDSTNVVTDAMGNIRQVLEYEPFGKTIEVQSAATRAEEARRTFSSHYADNETGLYYMRARYYDPSLGRFLTADTIVQNPHRPSTFNRYSYAGNNPINHFDPDGHGWLKKQFRKIDRALNKFVNWLEDVTNSQWSIDVEIGQSHGFEDAQTFSRGAGELAYLAVSQPWQIGIGVARWWHEPRFDIYRETPMGTYLPSRAKNKERIFVNGILNDLDKAFANGRRANSSEVVKVAYNPSDGALADVTESFLQKLTFTSSLDRQLSRALAGRKEIILSGHSQGGIIIGNTMLNLGLRDQRDIVSEAIFFNTQISEPRARISAAMAGVQGKHVAYHSRHFDFSNALGPNFTDPPKLLTGAVGLMYLPLGMKHHGIE